jgi:hypothetical protein
VKRIVINSAPHSLQAYDTIGDYAEDESTIAIVVSDLGDEEAEMLVALHELCEVMLMRKAGIPLEASTRFDIPFEAARARSAGGPFVYRDRLYAPDAEPGDSPDAPYQREHNFATAVERMMCAALGRTWESYERACAHPKED